MEHENNRPIINIIKLCDASVPNGSSFFSVAVELINKHDNKENDARINSAKKFIRDNFPCIGGDNEGY